MAAPRSTSTVKVLRIALGLLLVWAQLPTAAAEPSAADRNWPQWRGPLCTGAAPAADPPVSWSETSNIRWKVKLPGTGQSTPVVWEDYVFVQTAVPTGRRVESGGAATPSAPAPGGRSMSTPKPTELYQFVLLCLDRQTGQTLWQKIACEQAPHEGHHRTDGSFAAASPITDGKHVFAFFGSRGLYCYDMQGNLQWLQDFGDMRIAMSFGEGSSPALAGEVLVVNWDHEGDSFIVALDKNTGKTLWKVPRDERTSWSTPLIVEQDGQRQVVVAATKKIRSYELETGKMIWECAGLTRNVVPSPVAADGMIYATSGYQGNALLAIHLGRSGDLTGTDAIAWSYRRNTPYVPSPLLYGGRIYLFAGNNGVLSCFDAKSGKVLIDAKKMDDLEGVYASPVGANGRVYLVGRNGVTIVIKDSDTLEVLATNHLDEHFDGSPAIAGGDLFLRGREHLYCIASKERPR